MSQDVQQAISTVWRAESARVIAVVSRIVRDVGVAEELAQDALVLALERWPASGVPDNPGAWLVTAAKHRAIDRVRHRKLADKKHEQLGAEAAVATSGDDELVDRLDDDIGDDVLRLVFTACHPVLPQEQRVALTLRMLCGLTTPEIARAFLVPEPTMAQRIVRAKRALADAKVPFEAPRGEERAARLTSVLEVIYLVFNEGYAASSGDDWVRPALIEDALRLGRLVARLAPDDAETHGLLALMEFQASRIAARTTPDGDPILLADQDRGRWDQLMIRRGLDSLARAEAIADPRGAYTLQAAIAACHARAPSIDATDWARIADLYGGGLVELTQSPVVELNRAVAVGMADGPAAGLAIVDALADVKALASYPFLPSVRADLLLKLGRSAEAKRELERAAALTDNARDRKLLLDRAAACDRQEL